MLQDYTLAINDSGLDGQERLEELRKWEAGRSHVVSLENAEINNHIHTVYSFSPYTPSMAALLAREAMLAAAGSVDHDSIAAAEEMLSACALLGIGGCVGFEVRAGFKTASNGKASAFACRKLNNPDSAGYAYMTVQGIPRQFYGKAAEFLKPLRVERLKRTRAMAESANALLKEAGLNEINFEADILAKSKYALGGGITERHLLAAIAEKLILKYGKGESLVQGLKTLPGVTIPPRLTGLLSDSINNTHYLYDLLGVLKSELLGAIFIQPDEKECVSAESVTAFASSISAISAYAYLGDVAESPTGDKKAEKFEDNYIEELFAELSKKSFKAITYMPPRNTMKQLLNLRRLSSEWGFMEISGVDINSSRQSFNCPEVLHKEFRHLLDTTWALIAHERLASVNEKYGLFSGENPLASLSLEKKLEVYSAFGKKLNLNHPDESAAELTAEIDKGRIV